MFIGIQGFTGEYMGGDRNTGVCMGNSMTCSDISA